LICYDDAKCEKVETIVLQQIILTRVFALGIVPFALYSVNVYDPYTGDFTMYSDRVNCLYQMSIKEIPKNF